MRAPAGRGSVGAALGLGLFMGAVELCAVAARGRLDFSVGGALGLLTLSLGQGALLGLLFGLPVELVARAFSRGDAMGRGVLRIGGLVFTLTLWLCAFELQSARALGLLRAQALFLALPLVLSLVAMLQARAFLRAAATGRVRVGLLPVASGAALLLGLGGVLALLRPPSSAAAASGETAGDAARPPVLFITVDTLRRDHVGAFGPSPAPTPALDALARTGVRFEDAISPLPETLPAHAALFTGRHPARIGVLSNAHGLSPGALTLAEVLSQEGYQTAAFVSSAAVTGRTGIDQGFQRFDDDFFPYVRGATALRSVQLLSRLVMRLADPTDFPSLLERPAPVTLSRAERWIVAQGEAPWFAWVHLFEPHSPYEPHGLPGFEDNGTPESPALLHRDILSNEDGFSYTPEVEARLQRLYAEEVAYTDGELGRFVASIQALPGPAPILVFVADHGEMLGEHDIHFNHHGIYDEVVRVPLFIVLPGDPRAGRVVDRQTRLMDVPAMLLSLLKLQKMESSEGQNLLPSPDPAAAPHPGLGSLLLGRKGMSFSEGTLTGYRAPQSGVAGCMKLVLDQDSGAASVFDLRTDPGEQTDKAATYPATATLRAQVERETRDLRAAGATAGGGGDTEALKALGYLE